MIIFVGRTWIRQVCSDVGAGNGKISWACNIVLIKGLLLHIWKYKPDVGSINTTGYREKEDIVMQHTIVKIANKYKNMSYSVCLDLKKMKIQQDAWTGFHVLVFGAQIQIAVHMFSWSIDWRYKIMDSKELF